MAILVGILCVLVVANLVILLLTVAGQRLCSAECGACGHALSEDGELVCEACNADLSVVGISAGVVIRQPNRGILVGLAVILVLSILPMFVMFGYVPFSRHMAAGIGKNIERQIIMTQGPPAGGMFTLAMVDRLPHVGSDMQAEKWLELREDNGDTPPYRVDLVVGGERVEGIDVDTPMSAESIKAWFMSTGKLPDEAEAGQAADALLVNISRNLPASPTGGYGVRGGYFSGTSVAMNDTPIPHGPLAWVAFWGAVSGVLAVALFTSVWLVLRFSRTGDAA